MKKVKHPLPNLDLAEENRDYHNLLFSFGNAVYLYHSIPIEPTIQDYDEWLEGLPEDNFRKDMQEIGFESCKTILSFTRYIREKHDIGMDKFIEETMGKEQYNKYKLLFD